MSTPKFSIKETPIKEIKLWKENPRKNDEAVPKLMEIIKEHGVRSPIVAWSKNKTIYKGNTTYKACLKLGLKTVPVIFAEFKSEADAIAYAVADNKASEWAEWDDNVLVKLLTDRKMINLENIHSKLGYTQKEFTTLKLPKQIDEDTLAEVDIQGTLKDKANYILIYFSDDTESLLKQKSSWNMKPNQKTITYQELAPLLKSKPLPVKKNI